MSVEVIVGTRDTDLVRDAVLHWWLKATRHLRAAEIEKVQPKGENLQQRVGRLVALGHLSTLADICCFMAEEATMRVDLRGASIRAAVLWEGHVAIGLLLESRGLFIFDFIRVELKNDGGEMLRANVYRRDYLD